MGSEATRPCLRYTAPGIGLVLAVVALVALVVVSSARAAKLSEKKAQAAAVSAQIAALKARAGALDSSWLLAQRKLNAVRQAVKASEHQLAIARLELDRARKLAAQRVTAMYKERSVTIVDVIAGSADFSEMVSQLRLMVRMNDYDRDVVTDLRTTRQDVADKHEQLVAAQEAAALLVQQTAQKRQTNQLALTQRRAALNDLTGEIQQLQASVRQPAGTASPTADKPAADKPAAEPSPVPVPTSQPAQPSGGWWPAIKAAAAANGISAAGLYKLMMIESGGIQTIVGGGQFCGLFQYWTGTWKASWNPWRSCSIFDGYAQIKATALAIGQGHGPAWWTTSYARAFGGA